MPMPKLTAAETNGLQRAVEAEYVSKRAAAEARERFGSVAVFSHLEESAARHIAVLCETLHLSQEKAPVLAPAAATTSTNLIETLEAAADRETRTAAIYDDVIQRTTNAHLKSVLLPLWQSVSHLHLVALTDHLSLERSRTESAQPPSPDLLD